MSEMLKWMAKAIDFTWSMSREWRSNIFYTNVDNGFQTDAKNLQWDFYNALKKHNVKR